jgi:hypothetical protein
MKSSLYRVYDEVTETTSDLITLAAAKGLLSLWRDRLTRLGNVCLGASFLEAVK